MYNFKRLSLVIISLDLSRTKSSFLNTLLFTINFPIDKSIELSSKQLSKLDRYFASKKSSESTKNKYLPDAF